MRDLLEGNDFEISVKEGWEKVFCYICWAWFWFLFCFVFFLETGYHWAGFELRDLPGCASRVCELACTTTLQLLCWFCVLSEIGCLVAPSDRLTLTVWWSVKAGCNLFFICFFL